MPGAQEGEIMGHHGDFNDFDGDMIGAMVEACISYLICDT